jgi:hypothetical protein
MTLTAAKPSNRNKAPPPTENQMRCLFLPIISMNTPSFFSCPMLAVMLFERISLFNFV